MLDTSMRRSTQLKVLQITTLTLIISLVFTIYAAATKLPPISLIQLQHQDSAALPSLPPFESLPKSSATTFRITLTSDPINPITIPVIMVRGANPGPTLG